MKKVIQIQCPYCHTKNGIIKKESYKKVNCGKCKKSLLHLLNVDNTKTVMSIINGLQKHISFFDGITSIDSLNDDEKAKVREFKEQHVDLATKEINFLSNGAKIEVAVVGNFSSGKSTFINSFLGEEVCPMSVEPTTSSVTKFYFSPAKNITKDGKDITQDEYLNFSKHKQNIQETKSYSFEYGYPFVDFANINLYDTPGFANEKNKNDEKVTLDLLKKADVILYVVDVSSGTIKADELERLKTLKDKRIYCILNKADNSTTQNIKKVINELDSKNIFKLIAPYSSIKVLEEAKNNLLKSIIDDIQQNKIPNKKKFSIVIKGEEEKGRRTSKYKVNIRDIVNEEGKKDIDISYIEAFRQKESILKLLQNIAKEQSGIVQKSIVKDKIALTNVSKNYLNELYNRLKMRRGSSVDLSIQFEKDIDIALTKIDNYEEKLFLELNIANEYKKCFTNSIICEKVSNDEKSYWIDPYFKIIIHPDKFDKTLENIQNGIIQKYFKDMKTILNKVNTRFKQVYNFEFEFIEKSDLNEIVANQLVKIAKDNDRYYYYENDYISDENDYYEEYKYAQNMRKAILQDINNDINDIIGIISINGINENQIHQKLGELKAQKTTDSSTELQSKIKTYIEGL